MRWCKSCHLNCSQRLDCIMEQLGMWLILSTKTDQCDQMTNSITIARLHCGRYPTPETAIQNSTMGQPTQNSE